MHEREESAWSFPLPPSHPRALRRRRRPRRRGGDDRDARHMDGHGCWCRCPPPRRHPPPHRGGRRTRPPGGLLALGAQLIATFSWTFLLFGIVLLGTAVKLLRDARSGGAHLPDVRSLRSVRVARRLRPVTDEYAGTRLTVRIRPPRAPCALLRPRRCPGCARPPRLRPRCDPRCDWCQARPALGSWRVAVGSGGPHARLPGCRPRDPCHGDRDEPRGGEKAVHGVAHGLGLGGRHPGPHVDCSVIPCRLHVAVHAPGTTWTVILRRHSGQ